jgi:hypothetical protein
MTVEIDLEYISSEWAKDTIINDLDIPSEVKRLPQLHSKWLTHISSAKDMLRRLAKKYITLRKIKFRYYRGELSREDLVKYGWQQWQGTKPLKGEMDEFLKGDSDLLKLEDQIKIVENMIWTMEQILRSLHQRGFDLKTLLAAKQFYSGFGG